MALTQHLFLISIIFLSDPFTAMTVQFISVENCFQRGIMKFQYLFKWLGMCRAKIWEDIMSANKEGEDI